MGPKVVLMSFPYSITKVFNVGICLKSVCYAHMHALCVRYGNGIVVMYRRIEGYDECALAVLGNTVVVCS